MTIASLTETITKRRRAALERRDTLTAEEVLEALLYDLRAGELQPDALMVVYAVSTGEGAHDLGYYTAAAERSEPFFLAGMLTAAAREMLEGE